MKERLRDKLFQKERLKSMGEEILAIFLVMFSLEKRSWSQGRIQ